MAETNNALRDVVSDWLARRDAQEAAFGEIRFGEDGDFQRAVSAVTLVLKPALTAKPKAGEVGASFLEVFPMLMRSEQAEVTNETVEQLIAKAATDFYSFQRLEWLALSPVLLRHLPALRAWQQQVYLGATKPPARRGQHINANYFRDNAICTAITKLKDLGFNPYRGKSSPRTSASDVVVDALAECGQSVSYDAVAKIWENQDKLKVGAAGKELANGLAEQLLARLSDSNRP